MEFPRRQSERGRGNHSSLGLASILSWSILLLSGCAEELGPTEKPAARVAGRVHVGGAPIGGGWIEFFPVDGTVGDLRSAPLGKDGGFTATGIAVGTNLIRIVHPPPPPESPYIDGQVYRLFQQPHSPIRREIRGPSARVDVDLREESRKEATRRALQGQGRG